MEDRCYIRLFGGVSVSGGSETVSKFQTQKTASLLAYLAIHPEKSFSRDYVAELLWPDGDSVSVRNRLNQAVSSLRRLLESVGVAEAILSDATSIQINAPRVTTDLVVFDELLAEAGADPAHAISKLIEAVSIYRGDFLEGFPDEWSTTVRIRCWDAYVQALTRLIKHFVEANQPEQAISFARQRLAVNVRDERSHRALMRLYLLADRPESAIAQYRELEAIMRREGWSPSARARDLFDQATKIVTEGDDELVHVPALVVSGEIVSSMPSRPPRMLNVPPNTNLFVGRVVEIEELKQSLVDSKCKLVALTGLGGIGKSRLAAEFVRTYAAAWENRVAWNLASGFPEPERLEAAMLEAAAQLTGNPESSEETGLIILDEVGDMSLSQFSAILRHYPNFQILMTRRKPVLHPEVAEITLGPLDDCVELLHVRVAAHGGFLSEDPETRAHLQILCKQLGAIPLAIELLAVRAKTISPAHFVQEAERMVRSLLDTPVQSFASTAETLSQVFEASTEDLSPTSLLLMRQLAVSTDSLRAETLQNLNPDVDVLIPIEEMVRRGLVVAEDSRYKLHSILREYIWMKTAPEERTELELAFARYFSHYAVRNGFSVEKIAFDLKNVERATEIFERHEQPKRALLVRLSLGYTFLRIEQPERISAALMASFARLEGSLSELMRARVRLGLSHLGNLQNYRQNAPDPALFEVLRRHGLNGEQVLCRIRDTHIQIRNGNLDQALNLANEAIELAKTTAAPLKARSWLTRGHVLMTMAQDTEALAAYQEAVRMAREPNDSIELHAAWISLANLLTKLDRLEEARHAVHEAQRAMAQVPDSIRGYDAISLLVISEVERRANNFGLALRYLEDATQFVSGAYRITEVALQVALTLDSMGWGFDALEIFGAVVPNGFAEPVSREEGLYVDCLRRNLALPGGEGRFAAGRRRSVRDAISWGIMVGLNTT